MLKRTIVAALAALGLLLGSAVSADAYTYYPTRICYPWPSSPGTWMKISAWTLPDGHKRYHFSFRESYDYNGTSWNDLRWNDYTGLTLFRSSPYDNNPTDRYVTLNNHSYTFSAVWTKFWFNLPLGVTHCELAR